MSWSYIAGSLKEMILRKKEGRGTIAAGEPTAQDGRSDSLAERDLHHKGTTTERAPLDASAEPPAT